jgi:hypothetical protein
MKTTLVIGLEKFISATPKSGEGPLLFPVWRPFPIIVDVPETLAVDIVILPVFVALVPAKLA